MIPPSSSLPQIVVRDTLAVSGDGGALEAAAGRTIEFSLAELARLAPLLGAEGFQALAAYLAVLGAEELPDGRRVLMLDHFSAKWLMEHAGLTKNAAYRAQRALEDADIFARVAGGGSAGARGRTKAVLNGALVLIRGGSDAPSGDLRMARPGPRSGPVSRKAGDRESGVASPVSHNPGIRESGADSRIPGSWETGLAELAYPQVTGVVSDSRHEKAGCTSSKSLSEVQNSLMSEGSDRPGLLATVLVPALDRDRAGAIEALHGALNHARYSEALAQLNELLSMGEPPTRQLRALLERFADVLLRPELAASDVRALGVVFEPNLAPLAMAERLVVGVLAGMGAPRLQSWGGWMGQALRRGWKARPNTPLRAVESALLSLEAAEERAAAKAARSSARPAHTAPDAPDDGPDETVREEGSEVPLPEDLVARYIEEAFTNPEFAGFARLGDRGNPAHQQRVVRLHLSSLGLLPAPEQQAG